MQPLIELAEERSRLVAQELQRLRQQWAEAEHKLQQLKSYLAEYRSRLNDNVCDGVSVNVMRDFQRFIAKLELAIRAQVEEVERYRQRWETTKRLWMEREREIKAYHILRERHIRQLQHAENKREQRVQDESAQRIACSRARDPFDPPQ
ncbi:MAG: flagellar export protein FliJ [Methylophilaceae bacterium]|nr:flagellar export protein FliJ [Methylophilaceae bacterium]